MARRLAEFGADPVVLKAALVSSRRGFATTSRGGWRVGYDTSGIHARKVTTAAANLQWRALNHTPQAAPARRYLSCHHQLHARFRLRRNNWLFHVLLCILIASSMKLAGALRGELLAPIVKCYQIRDSNPYAEFHFGVFRPSCTATHYLMYMSNAPGHMHGDGHAPQRL